MNTTFDKHKHYMQIALEEAKKSFAKNEVPVGAVIVNDDGDILAKAHNQVIGKVDVTAHAEILAIRYASSKTENYRLVNSTIYVTIEPCMMCMGAIIHARIKELVFAAFDKKWGAAGSLYDFAKDKKFNHSPKITSGVLEEKAIVLMKDFFKQRR